MKNTLAALIVLFSIASQAQFLPMLPAAFDKECFVTLIQNKDGKKKKASVPRKAHVRVSKDINAGFFAKYYSGEEPVDAIFFLEDAHTKEREYFFSSIQYHWNWTFDVQTKYGLAHVQCS
jgi:hypothetical protein